MPFDRQNERLYNYPKVLVLVLLTPEASEFQRWFGNFAGVGGSASYRSYSYLAVGWTWLFGDSGDKAGRCLREKVDCRLSDISPWACEESMQVIHAVRSHSPNRRSRARSGYLHHLYATKVALTACSREHQGEPRPRACHPVTMLYV